MYPPQAISQMSTSPISAPKASVDKHQIPAAEIDRGDYKYDAAWPFERARPLRRPVPLGFPRGAVIWVNLGPEVSAMVEQELAYG
jgi:hypothetical protein